MGVDANYYVLYGIEWKGPELIETWKEDAEPLTYNVITSSDGTTIIERNLEYNYKWFDEHNIEIVVEPYGMDWTIIGLRFLDSDVNKTIDNLRDIEAQWNAVVNTFRDAGYKEELPQPCIISEAYFS